MTTARFSLFVDGARFSSFTIIGVNINDHQSRLESALCVKDYSEHIGVWHRLNPKSQFPKQCGFADTKTSPTVGFSHLPPGKSGNLNESAHELVERERGEFPERKT